MRFKPTDLGVALIDGYNNIGEVGLELSTIWVGRMHHLVLVNAEARLLDK